MSTGNIVRWWVSGGCVMLGLYLLSLSYEAYAKWWEYVRIGDLSGAEAYEVEFWPEAILAVLLLLLAGFLAGRASVGSRSQSERTTR